MAIKPRNIRRGGRNVLLATTVACGTTLAGILATGGVAHAAGSHAYVVADSCTDVAVSVVYSPGLRTSKDKSRHALLSGVISRCSDLFTGPTAGSGSISATLAGKASFDSENFHGTFTVTWPASCGLNPSTGTLSVADAGGAESVVGTVIDGRL
jgi:hypothetical protein